MSISQSRQTILVSFSGVDGAGKSTQIQALRDCFKQQGRTVQVIPFWDRVACLTGIREGAGHKIFKGEQGIGRPEAPVNRRDKNVRSWPMSCVRLCLYMLDAFATRSAHRRAMRSGAALVIFDRYLYDELANLNLDNPLMRIYARLLMALVPRPAVSFVLDADPALARARKPEYPLEFIRINRASYLRLCDVLGGMTVIAPSALDEVHAEIMRHLMNATARSDDTVGSGGMELERAR